MSITHIGRALRFSVLLTSVISAAASAATITVTTTADTTADDGQCSLREAIVAANTDTASGATFGECPAGGATGTDTVVLTSATYSLTSSVPDTTYGPTGLPTVTSAITIQGHGATIRRASGVFRIARVDAGGTLTLDRVTIKDGRVSNVGSNYGYGAGLLNLSGTLILTNHTVVRNNTIRLNGGGSWGRGGGIHSSTGTLTVADSIISDNLVDVTSGSCSRAVGGGLSSSGGTATIIDSAITSNRVVAEGTGSCTAAGWGGGGAGSGSLTITRTLITKNEASSALGAGLGGGLRVFGPTSTIDQSTIIGNRASGPSGGKGGGLFLDADPSSNTTVSNTTISNNEATGSGFGEGGGVSFYVETTAGSVTFANTTIANNRADGWGGGVNESEGPASLTVTNSIVAGNQVGGSLTDATADCSLFNEFLGSGHNLVGTGTGCQATNTTDRTVHPSVVFTNVLGPLGSSGGLAQIHPLRLAAGNPAVDGGDPSTCVAAPINDLDQLGASRAFDGTGDGTATCDIGATELQTVLPTISLTTSATVAPTTVAPGATTTITASVTSTLTQALLVDVEIYDVAGVQVYQQYFDAEPFTAGVQRSFTVDWAVPTDLAPGSYTAKIGVFSPVHPGWSPLFTWNDGAATITVQ